jgi:hypothetical protein
MAYLGGKGTEVASRCRRTAFDNLVKSNTLKFLIQYQFMTQERTAVDDEIAREIDVLRRVPPCDRNISMQNLARTIVGRNVIDAWNRLGEIRATSKEAYRRFFEMNPNDRPLLPDELLP